MTRRPPGESRPVAAFTDRCYHYAVMLRAIPQIGGAVRVNFLGSTVGGTVKSIAEDGRQLEVATEDGETLTFALNRATATFTANGDQTGARLIFDTSDGSPA